ncbi:MAG: hypothetical protein JXA69_10110 [Phycisphaerae bacterium]|nr:hypothetical protein [Phycisphaerae bacterium]
MAMRFGIPLGAAAVVALVGTVAAAEPAASYVRPIDLEALNQKVRALPAGQRERVALYMEAARRTVLDVTDGCFPENSFREHGRNLAERAKGAAVLASLTDYWPKEFREHCRTEATRYVHEVAEEHRKHANFQYEWQAAFWAAEAGIAGWFLWDSLDADLREAVAEMVIFQADRFIDTKPTTHYQGNTEAETVAWNSTICTLAVNMMPEHPHNAAWDKAAKTYLYNTFSVPQDADDARIGDDGRAVKDWIVGPNLYGDFALENHDMFHVGYVFACYRFHIQGAVLYWLTGRELPMALHHHARDVYEKLLLPCMNNEGFFAFVSDNDWKRYHIWTEACELHAYMACLEHHPLASSLEERALRNATRYWRAFPEGFEYDNRYVCGKPWTSRIADAVLMHAVGPGLPEAVSDAECTRELQGTFGVKSTRLLTQHSAGGSLRSFCKTKPDAWVRFVAPSAETWIMLPLASNYRGQIDGKAILGTHDIHSDRGKDWFWVARQDASSGLAEAFVSLPDELVLFAEYALADALPAGKVVENLIGIEKPHRDLKVHFEGGAAEYKCGTPQWTRSDGAEGLALPGQWVSLDGRMGLRFAVPAGTAVPEVHLPKAGARGAVRAHTGVKAGQDRVLCIAICPGQSSSQTASLEVKVSADPSAGSIECTAGDYTLIVNVGSKPLRRSPTDVDSADNVIVPGSPGVWLRSGKRLF